MSSHKRGGSFNHYGDRNQHFNKKPRPNHATGYEMRKNIIPQLRERAELVVPVLSAREMQTGLVALLDRFVAAETTPEADKDILYHACALRRLLSSRNDKSVSAQAKRELDEKRPEKTARIVVPDYVERKVVAAKELPPLPTITETHLHEAVFTHRSAHIKPTNVHQTIDLNLDYERLELLGDAYIELMATRALYSRFPHVEVPQLSSWRERLVENATLSQFSEAYGFPDRLKHKLPWEKDSKAWTKVVADVFEAYVAGIVLSDPDNGFNIAEQWLDELWATKLLDFKETIIENTRARDDLQKLCFVNHVEIKYKEERAMVYEHGVQNYFIGVYLTGWGYEQEWLGSGEGRNKVQASIAAATDALKRNNSALQDAARQKTALMEARAKEREEKARAEAAKDGQGEEHSATRHSGTTADGLEGANLNLKNSSADSSPDKKSKKHKKDKKEKK
ncbi:ribonuclease III domain-containing protein [Paraphoma chrysanthemicola]|uniref:Ribonuclease III domain-containing protein n=1 Tax=Paraphoma chrysanthemicola TaxID=798071 RepID=A0A8K0VYY9_9PLEO|nr:ribonuclease III domain-containing protein [Paraphoma chrysanthemicola]